MRFLKFYSFIFLFIGVFVFVFERGFLCVRALTHSGTHSTVQADLKLTELEHAPPLLDFFSFSFLLPPLLQVTVHPQPPSPLCPCLSPLFCFYAEKARPPLYNNKKKWYMKVPEDLVSTSPCVKVGLENPVWETGSQKPAKETTPAPIVRGHTRKPFYTTVTYR